MSLERQSVDGQIAALALKISNQEALLQESALYSGITPNAGGTLPTYSYSIVRDGGETAADMSTKVQAGDVVVARLSLAP